jgi:hypothetical protein
VGNFDEHTWGISVSAISGTAYAPTLLTSGGEKPGQGCVHRRRLRKRDGIDNPLSLEWYPTATGDSDTVDHRAGEASGKAVSMQPAIAAEVLQMTTSSTRVNTNSIVIGNIPPVPSIRLANV